MTTRSRMVCRLMPEGCRATPPRHTATTSPAKRAARGPAGEAREVVVTWSTALPTSPGGARHVPSPIRGVDAMELSVIGSENCNAGLEALMTRSAAAAAGLLDVDPTATPAHAETLGGSTLAQHHASFWGGQRSFVLQLHPAAASAAAAPTSPGSPRPRCPQPPPPPTRATLPWSLAFKLALAEIEIKNTARATAAQMGRGWAKATWKQLLTGC